MPTRRRKPLKRVRRSRSVRYRSGIHLARPVLPWKPILMIAAFVIAAIAIINGPTYLGSMQSFIKSIGTARIDTSNDITLAIDWGSLGLVTINPHADRAVVYLLPQDIYVPNSDTIGSSKLSAVYTLAETSSPGTGGSVLKDTISKNFALPIDGYVKLHKPYQGDIDVQDIRRQVTSLWFPLKIVKARTGFGGVDTDISTIDALKLWWQVRHIRFDKVEAYNVKDYGRTKQVTLADGSKVLGISEVMLDTVITDMNKDSQIRQEGAKVEIVNASSIVGRGQWYTRLVSNLGAHVVRVDTAPQDVEHSQLIIMNEKATEALVKKLRQFKNFAVVDAPDDQNSLGDIRIVIGKDEEE